MKRLHHFLIFILSVTILCLSTGMSHIHICSDQCCKAKECLVHSSIQSATKSCCEASLPSEVDSQQLSSLCTCFQVDYTTDFYFSHADYVLPAVMPMDLPTPVLTWYSSLCNLSGRTGFYPMHLPWVAETGSSDILFWLFSNQSLHRAKWKISLETPDVSNRHVI